MQIVGKRFSPKEFADYASEIIKKSNWKGKFIVLHNTGAPNLAQRPNGLTPAHILNLKSYYEGLGWHAGPHIFADQNGIWVFSSLSASGIHSPSWNSVSYGVEQLGDFAKESYTSGDGAKVHANAVAAMAVICKAAGIDSQSIRLHKEDPKTDHDCPGKNCSSIISMIKSEVHDYIVKNLNG